MGSFVLESVKVAINPKVSTPKIGLGGLGDKASIKNVVSARHPLPSITPILLSPSEIPFIIGSGETPKPNS